MSKKLLKKIVKVANVLDSKFMHDEADNLTKIAEKISLSYDMENYSMDDSYDMDRTISEPDPECLKRFENSDQFRAYQRAVGMNASYRNNDELRMLEEMLKGCFKGTDLEDFEDEAIAMLVERNFQSRSEEFTAFEEVYEDLAWDVNNNAEKNDVSRNPLFN